MTTSPIVVTSAVRTPIGRFHGSFAGMTAPELGSVAVKGALERAQVAPEEVDRVILGMARQAGAKPNPARQVLWGAGIPEDKTAFTVNQACASGLKTMQLAADEIRLGRAQVVVAGGMENMTRVPFLLEGMRSGYRLGDGPVVDGMYRDGFHCPLADMVMGETAELLAQERGISREEQDAYALDSQRKAGAAWEAGRFADEIVPVTVKSRKGDVVVDRDEHPRPQTTPEGLAKLPAVFQLEGQGSVTPGNASGIT
ncbi:MAG: thiolase family protein, partial [Planctomycetota bacterium]